MMFDALPENRESIGVLVSKSRRRELKPQISQITQI
jgi:hypothetical protein